MDHNSLNLYDDWEIHNEYIRLKGAVMTEQDTLLKRLNRLKLFHIRLEIIKRSKGKTHFAGHELVTR